MNAPELSRLIAMPGFLALMTLLKIDMDKNNQPLPSKWILEGLMIRLFTS